MVRGASRRELDKGRACARANSRAAAASPAWTRRGGAQSAHIFAADGVLGDSSGHPPSYMRRSGMPAGAPA
jgi:hypothetical protein